MKRTFHPTRHSVVFAAMSKRNFFLREHIIKFILKKGYTPFLRFYYKIKLFLKTSRRRRKA